MWALVIALCAPLHSECQNRVVDIYPTEAACISVASAYAGKEPSCNEVDAIVHQDGKTDTPE
ncbi:DUF1482 family protein [Hafnia alvei]|uniref:DUF1482 family protein n=1 Tax=Hafnia alvei TaxID=569 RepID=UPI0014126698|nr:hypothetical protein [Hafnia alvei]QIP56109.1 hypothetical protein HBA19_11035 [Hafnia alvei]